MLWVVFPAMHVTDGMEQGRCQGPAVNTWLFVGRDPLPATEAARWPQRLGTGTPLQHSFICRQVGLSMLFCIASSGHLSGKNADTALSRYPLVASEYLVSKLGFLRSLHLLSSSLLQMQRFRGFDV